MAALDADQDRDLPPSLGVPHARERVREDEVGVTARRARVDQLDRLERLLRRAAELREGRGHVGGEERRGDAPLLQPRDVDVTRRVSFREVDPLLPQALGHVLVGVDDDRGAVNPRGARLQVFGRGRGDENGGGGEGEEGSLHGAAGYRRR